MADRDVEKVKKRSVFIATLRRVADALEREAVVRIQVAGKRLLVPADAELSVEHEVESGAAELELQLRWHEAAPPRAAKAKRKAIPVKKKKAAKRS
ncbi:MAG: amphi-Trp domain-containing protein [Polyangiales bacterium]